MIAASQGPQLFSLLSLEDRFSDHRRRKTFVLSLLGETVLLAMTVYVTCCIIRDSPEIVRRIPRLDQLPLIFSGSNGGGGGNHDPLPASHGNLPPASIEDQIVPPTVIVPKEMPRLPAEQTVAIAPEIQYPQGGQIGDPSSPFSRWLSNGPGAPAGIRTGCCGGIGPSTGPGVGPGPSGIYPAGKLGVTVPQVIYSPEPNFSDEARQTKTQGVVTLIVVIGQDGHAYDIRIAQGLGMGLDEQAVNAVKRWRFRPATLNGQPVATQIAVEVNFRLY